MCDMTSAMNRPLNSTRREKFACHCTFSTHSVHSAHRPSSACASQKVGARRPSCAPASKIMIAQVPASSRTSGSAGRWSISAIGFMA